jgi:hypothetical protein
MIEVNLVSTGESSIGGNVSVNAVPEWSVSPVGAGESSIGGSKSPNFKKFCSVPCQHRCILDKGLKLLQQ